MLMRRLVLASIYRCPAIDVFPIGEAKLTRAR